MTTWHIAYTALVAVVGLQRVAELGRSGRNETRLRAHGAREHAPGQMPWMRALHASWLASCALEAWVFDRTPSAWVSAVAAVVLIVGQLLRRLAMRALGERWSVKILTLPNVPPVREGVFAWMRHPNYTGVVLEMAALPLIGGAYVTAIVFSLANAALLVVRIRAEERALETDCGAAALPQTDRP
jgi:methyltransferase